MDGYEATRIVFSRIQNLDPENASKIMGLLLIQDHGEKEMIRLAFGPEALVHSVIVKARKDLGLSSSSYSPSTPSSTPPSPSPFLSRQNSTPTRLLNTSNTGITLHPPPALTIPNPSSSPAWADDLMSPNNNIIVGSNSPHINIPPSSSSSASLPFYGSDPIDEFQLQDQLSFLNDGSPTLARKNPDLFYPHSDLSSSPTAGGGDPAVYGWAGSVHRRSCSVNDACLGSSEDLNSGLGWKPCLYFARGYCKNGTSCRFLHGSGGIGDSDGVAMVGSPSKIEMMDQSHELLRSKASQQQRLLMASSPTFPYSPKCMNFLLQQQQNDTQRYKTKIEFMFSTQ